MFRSNIIEEILRLVEILTIVRNLLLNNKFITKRNLYYQLVKYYKHYITIDSDITVICDTLRVERRALNIMASSRLSMFWFNVKGKNKSDEVKLELSYKKCKPHNI
jgi:DNA topoisomerase VI subunit A